MTLIHVDLTIERILTLDYIDQEMKEFQPSYRDILWNGFSYAYIIERFQATQRNNSTNEAWLERLTYIYPLFSRIPQERLNEEFMRKLADFENEYAQKDREKVLESMYSNMFMKTIHQIIGLANGLVKTGRGKYNLFITSSLLHFMLPDIFPIFDTRVGQILYDRDVAEEVELYVGYTIALHEYLSRGTFSRLIWGESEQSGLSPLHFIHHRLLQYKHEVGRLMIMEARNQCS